MSSKIVPQLANVHHLKKGDNAARYKSLDNARRLTMQTIASVTPTLCELFTITKPRQCGAESFRTVVQGESTPVAKGLVFAADAIGAHLVRDYEQDFYPVFEHAPIRVDASAVMPSVTPVCFAS